MIDIRHRCECGAGVQIKEGRIDPGSPLWAQLSPADQQKRQTAVAEAAVKLKSPNFVVSPTRVRLLNVPLTWDSKQLKACCQKAVVTRATQAKPKITQVRRSTAQHSTARRSASTAAGAWLRFCMVCCRVACVWEVSGCMDSRRDADAGR